MSDKMKLSTKTYIEGGGCCLSLILLLARVRSDRSNYTNLTCIVVQVLDYSNERRCVTVCYFVRIIMCRVGCGGADGVAHLLSLERVDATVTLTVAARSSSCSAAVSCSAFRRARRSATFS